MLWEPDHVFLLKALGYVRFCTIVVWTFLNVDVDYKVQVKPNEVILLLMEIKTLFSVTVELQIDDKKYLRCICQDHK